MFVVKTAQNRPLPGGGPLRPACRRMSFSFSGDGESSSDGCRLLSEAYFDEARPLATCGPSSRILPSPPLAWQASFERRSPMRKYVVLYRFTEQGAKDIRGTVARARQTREQNEKRGFKVQAMLWTQGPYDLVAVVEAPSEEAMMGGMVNVVSAGNVSSVTMRAFDEKEMEKILEQV
jgi:uncharacterized protein with GYD domain